MGLVLFTVHYLRMLCPKYDTYQADQLYKLGL